MRCHLSDERSEESKDLHLLLALSAENIALTDGWVTVDDQDVVPESERLMGGL